MIVYGIAISAIGKLFVAYAALRVHHRVLQDHDVDERVFTTMKREQIVGVIGFLLIAIGSILEIVPHI